MVINESILILYFFITAHDHTFDESARLRVKKVQLMSEFLLVAIDVDVCCFNGNGLGLDDMDGGRVDQQIG